MQFSDGQKFALAILLPPMQILGEALAAGFPGRVLNGPALCTLLQGEAPFRRRRRHPLGHPAAGTRRQHRQTGAQDGVLALRLWQGRCHLSVRPRIAAALHSPRSKLIMPKPLTKARRALATAWPKTLSVNWRMASTKPR